MTMLAYSTIKSVRDSGITEAKMADGEVSRLILQYSRMITKLIKIWFVPVSLKERFNGGGKLIKTNLPPVIKLLAVNIVNQDHSRTSLDSLEYEAIGKLIRFNNTTIDGVRNVELDGIFGEVENKKEVSVTITTDILEDSEYFDVLDASELEYKDVFIFDNTVLIANSIDYENNRITIDKQLNIKPIPSGSTTTCFGCIPLDIERAVNLMIKHNKTLTNQVGGRIKSEKTDDYSYELFQSGLYSTGVPEVDRILQTYLEDDIQLFYL